MKKNLLTLSAAALISLAASAQDLSGTSFEDRIGHGQDSIDVRSSVSLYGDLYKRGVDCYSSRDMQGAVAAFKEAYDPWKFVLEKAPLARVDTYKKGQFMLQTLITNEPDATLKQQYFEELMKLYDIRLANMDALNSFAGPKDQSSRGGIICRKAFDSYFMNPATNKNLEASYQMFREGINDTGNDTEGFVLYGFMQLSDARFKYNNDKYREDYINDYLMVTDVCGRLLDQAKEYPSTVVPADTTSDDSTKWVEQVILAPEAEKLIQAYQPPFDQAEALFVQSGAADCEALEKIYGPKVEANKTDLEYLNGVLKVLRNFECDKSDLYYLTADYAYEINKTPQAAIGKAAKFLKNGDTDNAIKFFDEAISLESDADKKAKYSLIVAQLLFSKNNISGCRNYCKKTLQLNPSMGKAYLLQASCIARSASGDHLTKSYYYCLAMDYCNRAKAVDPSSAATANRQAASYTAYLYPKSEAFFAGIKAGQTVSVMGETTTLRLR